MANCITGFSISNWLTLGFSFAPRDVAWRFPLAFQIFFTLCIWAMCPFLPDSPRLLIRKGKYEEAAEVSQSHKWSIRSLAESFLMLKAGQVIAALQGKGATPDSPSVRAQFDIIKDVLDREHLNTYTYAEIRHHSWRD
jgi:hypothetical protein